MTISLSHRDSESSIISKKGYSLHFGAVFQIAPELEAFFTIVQKIKTGWNKEQVFKVAPGRVYTSPLINWLVGE